MTNEEIIQSQEEKIKQQDTEFANNSDRIFKQGDLIEEQREELKQLTVRIEDDPLWKSNSVYVH